MATKYESFDVLVTGFSAPVASTHNFRKAEAEFEFWKRAARSPRGKASGQDVLLLGTHTRSHSQGTGRFINKYIAPLAA